MAHRGASRDAPENTLPAFNLAWKQGADAIEGDFHLTKDGHIVCIHDGDTRKVAAKNLRVSSSTLAELRALDIRSSDQGTKIPTIAEVFETVPDGKKIYVESLKAQGYEWHVWKVTDAGNAKKMVSRGVKSITTDVPGLMKKLLADRT